jgi:hypothetical protein
VHRYMMSEPISPATRVPRDTEPQPPLPRLP